MDRDFLNEVNFKKKIHFTRVTTKQHFIRHRRFRWSKYSALINYLLVVSGAIILCVLGFNAIVSFLNSTII